MAAAAATTSTAAPANGNQALLLALQGLEPAFIKVLLDAATNTQINAAANSTSSTMVGRGSPQTAEGTIVSPQASSPMGLEPVRMQELMARCDNTAQRTINASPPPTATGRHERGAQAVSFSLPDDPNHATLVEKLQEQEKEQQDKEVLIEFLSNQGKKPQNPKEYGDWLSRVGEVVAVLAMVHKNPDVQVVSNIVIYALSRGDDKKWKGKWLAALGDRNEKGEDPPFIRLKPSYFEWRGVKLPSDQEDSGAIATFYDKSKNKEEFCYLEGAELDIEQTHVPKFCLVPAKIALDALEWGKHPGRCSSPCWNLRRACRTEQRSCCSHAKIGHYPQRCAGKMAPRQAR